MPWPWTPQKKPPTIVEMQSPQQDVFTEFNRMIHGYDTTKYAASEQAGQFVGITKNAGAMAKFFDDWKPSPGVVAESYKALAALDSAEAVEEYTVGLGAKVYASLLSDDKKTLRPEVIKALGLNYDKMLDLYSDSGKKVDDVMIAEELTKGYISNYLQAMQEHYTTVHLKEQFEADPDTQARLIRYLHYQEQQYQDQQKGKVIQADEKVSFLVNKQKAWLDGQRALMAKQYFGAPIAEPMQQLIKSSVFMDRVRAKLDNKPQEIAKSNPALRINTIVLGILDGLKFYKQDLEFRIIELDAQKRDSKKEEELRLLKDIYFRVTALVGEREGQGPLEDIAAKIGDLTDDNWESELQPNLQGLKSLMDDLREVTPPTTGFFRSFFQRCYYDCCKLIGYTKHERVWMQREVARGLKDTLKVMDTKSMAEMLNAPKKLKVEKMKVIAEFNRIIRGQNPDNYLSSEAANKALNTKGISRLFDAWHCSPEAAAEAYKALAILGSSEAEATQHAAQLAAAVYKNMLKEDGKTLRDDVKKALGSKYAQFRDPPKKMDDKVIAERLTQAFMVSYSQAITMHAVENVLPAKMAKLKEDPDVQARLERYMRSQGELIPDGTPNRDAMLAKKKQSWFDMIQVRIAAQETGATLNSLQSIVSDQNELMAKMKAEIEGTQQKSTANNPVFKLTVMLDCLNSQLDAYLDDLALQIKYCEDDSEKAKLTELRQKVWDLRVNLGDMKEAIGELHTEKNWQSGLAKQKDKFESLMAQVNDLAKDAKSFKGDFDFCYYHCCKLMGHETAAMLKIEKDLAAGLQENPVSKAKDSLHHIMEEGHAKAVAGEGVEQGARQEAGDEHLGM